MATIRDVAKLAGVSVATVSRVINQNGYVNKETEDKVKASMAKLNYSPNALARGLANKRTNTLALIIPDITNPFFPELARAVEDTAHSLGYTLFLCNTDGNIGKELNYINSLKNRYVNGIIFASHQLQAADVDQLKKFGISLVSLDRAVDSQGTPSVKVNNYLGAGMAVDHLISIGCSNIALIGGPNHWITSFERYRGYIDAVTRENCVHPEYMVFGDFTMASGFALTEQLIRDHPEIDGIFACNDLMAIGALKALLRLGKRVPQDVALIGFDGISMLESMEPEISTVSQPIYDIGKYAVHILINQIERSDQIDPLINDLEVKLIQRATTMRLYKSTTNH